MPSINPLKLRALGGLAGLLWLAAGLSCALAPLPVCASTLEVRSYDVSIDNKPAGTYQLRLTDADKAVEVESRCDVDYRFLLFHYRYNYRGHEHWYGDQLVAFKSDGQDGGKAFAISACKEGAELKASINGRDRALPLATLTSSYWRLPKKQSFTASFLEVDSGRIFQGRFEYLGDQVVAVGSSNRSCRHYKLSGGDSGDLWYDDEDRLVRELTSGEGHPTLIQLRQIER